MTFTNTIINRTIICNMVRTMVCANKCHICDPNFPLPVAASKQSNLQTTSKPFEILRKR